MKLTVVLRPDPDDGGYVAECPAIPGWISEGDTVEEALVNIREAAEECLESLAERGEPLPEQGLCVVAAIDADLPQAAAV